MIFSLILLFLIITLTIILFSFSLSFLSGAPYYPSSRKTLDLMISIAELQKHDKIIELGSGDGRLLIQLAKKGYKVEGIEINLFLYLIAKLRIILSGQSRNIRLYRMNFFDRDLSSYNKVFCYLFPPVMPKLEMKLKTELKNRSKVISYVYKFNNIKPTHTIGNINSYSF